MKASAKRYEVCSRHAPKSYISWQLDGVGLVNHFGGGTWKPKNGSLIDARGVKEGALYVIQGKLYKGEVNIVYDNSNLELWHKRLGHISEKGLQILARKEPIPDLKGKSLEPCTAV